MPPMETSTASSPPPILCQSDCYPPYLHSFPTRRSSDLNPTAGGRGSHVPQAKREEGRPAQVQVGRSEEHTSELQSRGHLVCRLLLEKKKRDPARSANSIARSAWSRP